MKLTEGLLKKTFETISREYPDIKAEHILIDNCAHQLVKRPEQFDVIVTTNMNGDIISDLTSALIGGLGFAPSANIGNDVAIFEAVHGSAPKYAGKNVINPTAMILSGVMMLRHLGEIETAQKVEGAVLFTLESGEALTRDVTGDEGAASTSTFTEVVIKNLGKKPGAGTGRQHKPLDMDSISSRRFKSSQVERIELGVDIFIESESTAQEIGDNLNKICAALPLELKMISNRGTQVFPLLGAAPDTVNHYRCRFKLAPGVSDIIDDDIITLLLCIRRVYRWNHVEKLTSYGGVEGFTRAQGED